MEVLERRGNVLLGLLQTLGVHVAGLAVLILLNLSATHHNSSTATGEQYHPGQSPWGWILAVAFALSIALGAAQLRSRPRTATGAFLGSLVWPCVFGVAFAVLAAYAMSHARIPF